MQKRTQLILLVVLVILLLLLGAWFFLWPLRNDGTPNQPPGLPTNVLPVGGTPTNETPTAPAPVVKTPAELTAEAKMLAVQNRARATVERIGSGTSVDGFLGYNDAFADMTVAGRSSIVAEQQSMQRTHPPTSVYGISTRAVSASTQNATYGDSTLLVTVQAIQSIDAGDPSKPVQTKGRSAAVTFVKQSDGSYLIDRIEWTDVAL